MIRQRALRLSSEDYRREKIEFSISPALGKQTAVSMEAQSMAALFGRTLAILALLERRDAIKP